MHVHLNLIHLIPRKSNQRFANISAQIDEEFTKTSPIEENSPWTTVEATKSSGIGDDEPWELEDNGEEKMTPIPTTTRLSSPFNDGDLSPVGKVNLHSNFFSDSFQPNEDNEQTLTKTVRFDDNVQNIRAATPPKDQFEIPSSESDDIEVDDIIPNFENNIDRMDTSFVQIDEKDLQVCRH